MDVEEKKETSQQQVALCASCDRCRSRKTKCDGARPCGNCAAKYMKKHKLTSIEGVDLAEFECVYSPAKRRGPVPGRSGQSRKAGEAFQRSQGTGGEDWKQQVASGQSVEEMQLRQLMIQNQQMAVQDLGMRGNFGGSAVGNALNPQQQALQQQIQQLQAQQQNIVGGAESDQPSARRVKLTSAEGSAPSTGVPRTIASHTHLLERNNLDGNRLRAYYRLSVDELYRLPPTPTDEEYCLRLNIPGMTPRMIPGTHLAALSAARFAEVALGALVHSELSLAMEICNAVVHCLRESIQEQVQPACMFEVARAYFLLGVFRVFRGDMERYFKYRRVAITYLSKMEDDTSTAALLSAISYLDSLAYLVYNADESKLPQIDKEIPRVGQNQVNTPLSATEMQYNVKVSPCGITCNPNNQNWIQGAPPVYLNNEAPLTARSLDALACAVRTCCDQANGRFAALSKDASGGVQEIPQETIITPTTTAVLAHENEFCSRNMVLSAFTLLQQHEASLSTNHKNQGIHVVISAMDAFLENPDDETAGAFTDSQIQSLLSVCNSVIENPFILFHGGPTYHMVTNAAVMLCHLLNGMHLVKAERGDMETTMFEEVLDTFIAVRKLLVIHRRKLPVRLRCHEIPRPCFTATQEKPFVDLGETLLCGSRGCQGFVLMACSPCVAAERAKAASEKQEMQVEQETADEPFDDLERELDDLGAEFDLDDDALLNTLSQLISN